MATPFFGKRDTDPLNTPAALRQGTANGYSIGGASSAPQAGGPQANQKPVAEVLQQSAGVDSASLAKEGGSKLTVGPNIKLKGVEITDCDTLVVEGLVEATMDSRVIQIAEQGAFKGSAEIDVAEIRGEFSGNLTVRQKLVIEEGGQLAGEILFGATAKTPALVKSI